MDVGVFSKSFSTAKVVSLGLECTWYISKVEWLLTLVDVRHVYTTVNVGEITIGKGRIVVR